MPVAEKEPEKKTHEWTPEELKTIQKFPFVSVEKREPHRDRIWVAIDEDKAYPWALEILAKGEPPYLIPRQRSYVSEGTTKIGESSVPNKQIHAVALVHRDKTEPRLQELRADLLELARRYFTAAIHKALNNRPGLGVHIINHPDSKDRWKQ